MAENFGSRISSSTLCASAVSGNLDRDPDMLGNGLVMLGYGRDVIEVSEDSREPGRGAGSGSLERVAQLGPRVWAPVFGLCSWAGSESFSFYFYFNQIN